MKIHVARLACASLLYCIAVQAAAAAEVTHLPPAVQHTAEMLRSAGLKDANGYAILEDLVTRIGPRLAGSEAEARARRWAEVMLRQQGFASVRTEAFPLSAWQPLGESASIVSPESQSLVIAALGGSPGTQAGGITADVVRFESLQDLQEAAASNVAGKIAYIDEPMARTSDGSGYGAAVAKRYACGTAAKKQAALACLIRSVGTNTDRFTHQGMSASGTAVTVAPSAALAPPDADILTRLLARANGPVRVHIEIASHVHADAMSGNVLAEIHGREQPQQIVLAAAHLDSWSLGQGAVDNGAGVAIITAAARLINDLPQKPRRTIRLLLAGAEEQGGFGGIAYGAAHAGEQHVLAGESDAGSGRILRMRTRVRADAVPGMLALQRLLLPLAIVPGDNTLAADGGGTDIDPIASRGAAVLALNQDASAYFDVHHTANDTLAQVNPEALRQNIAAWAVALYVLAEMDWDLRPQGP